MVRRLLVHAPCRYMAFFYGKQGEHWGAVGQPYRGVLAALVPSVLVGMLLGFVVAAATGDSLASGAAFGAMIALALAIVFIAYAHILVYTLAFKGRDWREM